MVEILLEGDGFVFLNDLEMVTCGRFLSLEPSAGIVLCQNIQEMGMSSQWTGEKVNKKTTLQMHMVFCNLDFIPADRYSNSTHSHTLLPE